MGVSASFQIIPRPVGRLGLGSESHVVGRLGSGPRVGARDYLRGGGSFGRGFVFGEFVSRGSSPRISCRASDMT